MSNGPLDAEIAIVGAGVAGSAAAISLGRRGRRVLLVDRRAFPRDKPCGEGLMPNGVACLETLGVLDGLNATVARRIDGVRFCLTSGATAASAFPASKGGSGYALGIRRLHLDSLLLERAASTAGVEVVTGRKVRTVAFDADSVRLTSDTTSWRARVLVGADGLHSPVRSMLGWDARRPWRRYGVVGHFGGSGLPVPAEIRVVLAGELEAYVTPLPGDEALVALLGGRRLMQRMAGDLEGGYERIVRRMPWLPEGVRSWCRTSPVLATGPFAVRSSRVAGAGALLVGDAAGFLDPITGSGMASALEQALAAAAVIDEALDRSPGLPDLRAFTSLRRRIVQAPNLLTLLALGICVSPPLRRRATRALNGRTGLFTKLLEVNGGRRGLGSLSPRDWLALLSGR